MAASMERTAPGLAPYALSVLRIVTALLFIEHGTQKLIGWPVAEIETAFLTLPWFAGLLELFGGLMMVLGWRTRPISLVLSGLMAFAYWMAHAPHSPYPVVNGGDAAVLFCFAFLYFAIAGGGPLSVDALRLRLAQEPAD